MSQPSMSDVHVPTLLKVVRRRKRRKKKKSKVEKAMAWLEKHPGPDGSELHGTGSDQTIHGTGAAFHGTTAWEDILEAGYDVWTEPKNGHLWGKGAYFAASFEQADNWSQRSHGGQVLVTELPEDMETLVIHADYGPGQIAMLWWDSKFAGEAWADNRAYGRQKEAFGKERIQALLDGQESDEAREILRIALGEVEEWGGEEHSQRAYVAFANNRLQNAIVAAGYDALEVIPLAQEEYNAGTAGHQLVIYNHDILRSLEFDVAVGDSWRERARASLSKSAKKRWYLFVPGPVWRKSNDLDEVLGIQIAKHMGPGPHPSGTPQRVHGTSRHNVFDGETFVPVDSVIMGEAYTQRDFDAFERWQHFAPWQEIRTFLNEGGMDNDAGDPQVSAWHMLSVPVAERDEEWHRQVSENNLKAMIRNLDAAVSRKTTAAPVVLFRGRGYSPGDHDLQVGDTWTDPSFIATTTDARAARGYAYDRTSRWKEGKPLVMEIRVPAGYHVGVVHENSLRFEEFVLPRGSKFRVVGIEQQSPDGDQYTYVTVDLIDQFQVRKHYGPGPHPSGTEQDVHGRGRQRTHYTSAEQKHLSERRQKIQDRLQEISVERSNLGRWEEPADGGPREWVVDDPDAYDALEQEMNALQAEWTSTYEAITPPSAISGISYYGGSLTMNEVDLVRRRLGQIDVTRRRLLGRLEEFATPRGLGSMEDQTELHRIQHQIEELDAEEGELLVALTTPTLPGMEGPIVAEEGPPKPVQSASGKKTGTIYDTSPAEDPSDAYAIYEAKLKVDGHTYEAIVDSVSDRSTGGVQIHGFIQDEDGLEVGKFSRSLDPENATAYNNEFYIDEEYQGRGIGTMFLSHWEDELRATGYEKMRVSAADIGRYAWAVAGYSWDGFYPDEIMDELTHMVQNYNQDMGFEAMDYGHKGDDPVWDAAREMIRNYDAYEEWPEPFELAMLGAGTEDHIGKQVLLSDGMWDGIKYLH